MLPDEYFTHLAGNSFLVCQQGAELCCHLVTETHHYTQNQVYHHVGFHIHRIVLCVVLHYGHNKQR